MKRKTYFENQIIEASCRIQHKLTYAYVSNPNGISELPDLFAHIIQKYGKDINYTNPHLNDVLYNVDLNAKQSATLAVKHDFDTFFQTEQTTLDFELSTNDTSLFQNSTKGLRIHHTNDENWKASLYDTIETTCPYDDVFPWINEILQNVLTYCNHPDATAFDITKIPEQLTIPNIQMAISDQRNLTFAIPVLTEQTDPACMKDEFHIIISLQREDELPFS